MTETQKKLPSLQDVSIIHLMIEHKLLLTLLQEKGLLSEEEYKNRYERAAAAIGEAFRKKDK